MNIAKIINCILCDVIAQPYCLILNVFKAKLENKCSFCENVIDGMVIAIIMLMIMMGTILMFQIEKKTINSGLITKNRALLTFMDELKIHELFIGFMCIAIPMYGLSITEYSKYGGSMMYLYCFRCMIINVNIFLVYDVMLEYLYPKNSGRSNMSTSIVEVEFIVNNNTNKKNDYNAKNKRRIKKHVFREEQFSPSKSKQIKSNIDKLVKSIVV